MDKIEELLTRAVDKVYPTKEDLEKVLRSGKKLKLYQGFDPTGTQLHIGHMIGLRKLKQWQEAGHKVIFLIGDGTGQAGDPSGKSKSREQFFTNKELRENAQDYVKQASSIVNFDGENGVQILYNGDWLNKLTLPEILNIASHFSLQQLAERDLFQERMKKGETVNLREFLYPLLQGYDSVKMSIDLEIGGTDQTFNMLAGRSLLKAMRGKEKFVLTTPLLTDSRGVKIGKTEGNVIALTDKPEDLYGKIMSLPDDIIVKGLEYLTDTPLEEVREVEKAIESGQNPMQFKKKLAFEIVSQLNNRERAASAQDEFERVYKEGKLPSSIQAVSLSKDFISTATVAQVFLESGLVSSNSEAKRVITQGGTAVNDHLITDPDAPFLPYLNNGEAVIRKGKTNFKIVRSGNEK